MIRDATPHEKDAATRWIADLINAATDGITATFWRGDIEVRVKKDNGEFIRYVVQIKRED